MAPDPRPAPRTICVIDDEEYICDLLRLILESRDYRCLIAHDGREGLDLIRQHRPDAVVLDIMMPGMNGQELLAALRRDDATRSIPIMIITGLTDGDWRSDEEWRKRLGVEAFLSKPLDAAVLLTEVERLLAAGAAKAQGEGG